MTKKYTHLSLKKHGRDQAQIGVIHLQRPHALNALCDALMNELTEALQAMEADSNVGAVILTGSGKAFAAGADIKEMQDKNFTAVHLQNFITGNWETASYCRKPIIAAVAGYALGGGCELALMCDIILAADNAKFGQPEVTIGTMPGAGGSQRLTRIIGKSKAMEMCLSGRTMDATEAEKCGLVARVVAKEQLLAEAMALGETIAGFSRPVVLSIKEAVNHAYESHLHAAIRFERHLFYGTFATEDRSEGMQAFSEKRTPQFKHR